MQKQGRSRSRKHAQPLFTRRWFSPIGGHRLQVESLEARVLLSVSPNAVASPSDLPEAAPTYERYVSLGVSPAGTAGPMGMTASQIRHAYGIDQISFDDGTVQGSGTGETIAIIDAYNYPTASSDLHNFDVAMGLPDPPSLVRVSQTGSTTSLPSTDPAGAGSSNDWEVEEALDIEWAHAVAPDANILLVEANSASTSNLLTAVNYARQQPGVVAVSMSWSSGEYPLETKNDSYFTTPNGHAGVTFVAATGDDGEPGGYPAMSPNVLAVGGTTLTTSGSSGTYVSETGWSGSGGGISSYESQPSYQKGVVTQSTTQRTIPDVSFDASPGSGVSVYDSYDNGTSDPWETVGGTSLATPCWAGLVAIVDQGRSVFGLSSLDGPTGTLPSIYKLPTADIHDITTGSNGYSAGVGYDLVTGLGTPIANLLVYDLIGTNQPPTINAVSNPAAILENSAVQTINLNGISPGPPNQNGETVTITATSSNPSLIPNPMVSYTNPNTTGTLSYTPVTGAYGSAVITLTVMNSGGTTNGGVNTFTETFTVTVTQINLPPTIAPISSPQTVSVGTGAQTINLTGISYGPAGNLGQTVTITAASSNPSLVPNPTITYTSPNATGTLTYMPSTNGAGSALITVTVQNNGGTANGGSNTVTETFTIYVYPQNVLSTSTALTFSPSAITFGQSVTLTATVSSTTTPNEGIVTFVSGTTTLGTANVSNGVATLGVTILPAGSPAVTAVYNDPLFIYVTSTSPAVNITVNSATPSITANDAGGTYNGSAFAATATVNNSASLEGVTPTLSYYSGTAVTGTALSSAPTTAGTYAVLASFAGSTDYTTSTASTTFTISQAAPSVSVSDNGGTYSGSAFTATSASLEGVTPSLTYYSGTSTTGTALSDVPTMAGTYTVLASFAGSTDYISGTASTTFTISQAMPTVILIDNGGTYSGLAFTATTASLEGVTPSLTYYSGTSATGTALSGVPTMAGTYTVLASFAGSTDYISGTASTTFTISQAMPTVILIDNGGTYSGSAFTATTASLEGITPSLTYYSGTSATGTALSDVPTMAGTYTVLASFAGSTDYISSTASTTFTISQAAPSVSVTDNGGTYSGSAFTATTASLEGVTPSLTYYSGTSTTGTALSGVPTMASTYTVLASFAGSTDYTTGTASTTFTISQATPSVSVTDTGGTYSGSAFTATTASLEGITPGLTYYTGTSATGTALSGVPTMASTYTVLASFAGSTDYTTGTASTTFTISHAAPSVSVTDNGGTYSGSAFTATTASLEGITPGLTYYTGTSATGTSLSGTPATAGTYTVLASFVGSTDYTTGTANTTFTISQAAPSVSVTVNGGAYNSAAFAATDMVAGVGSQSTASTSLEGVTPSLSYYPGTNATGTALSGTPTTAGTYMALASFAGSTDYGNGTASTTFNISKANASITVSDNSGTYNGATFAATDTVAGVGSQSMASASLEGMPPSLTYYSGTSTTGTALNGAPSTAGTYTVLATFAGTADYTSGTASTTFTIAIPPSSSVTALPLRTSMSSFPVSWSGTAGSGGAITGYNISVSIDDGPFNSWLTTSTTSATYIENLPLGHTYGFISQAQDQAGNVEPAHTTADTTITTAQHPWQNPGNSMDVLGTGGTIVPDDALQVIDYLTNNGSGTVLSTTFPAGSLYYDVLGLGDVIPEDALNIIDFLTTVPTIPTTTTLTSTPATSQSGQSVTFTAKVVANELPAATPTGTVTFYDGSTSLGTGTLSSGVATFTTATLAVGTHSIQAVYGGGASATVNFDGGNSNSLTQTVNAIAPATVQPQVSAEFSRPLQSQSGSPAVSPAVVASSQVSGPINNSSPSSSAASAPVVAASTSPSQSSVKPLFDSQPEMLRRLLTGVIVARGDCTRPLPK